MLQHVNCSSSCYNAANISNRANLWFFHFLHYIIIHTNLNKQLVSLLNVFRQATTFTRITFVWSKDWSFLIFIIKLPILAFLLNVLLCSNICLAFSTKIPFSLILWSIWEYKVLQTQIDMCIYGRGMCTCGHNNKCACWSLT